ncbi:glycosyltransferase [Leucobacter sp. GX24907]
MPDRLRAEYVLPLRWESDEELPELTAYLRALSTWVDVTVVDGSDQDVFGAHDRAWGEFVRHIPVDAPPGANGKVSGVLTGLAVARHDAVVLADDDVRYHRAALAAVVAGLHGADLVKPQNFFDPLPWHARWDTGRILVNRALAADYPGTYGVRRSRLESAGGYSADVLFENLEMERTIIAAGGIVRNRPDIYVARLPPSARRFWEQRVRQAYDSWAQPWRLALEACILPIGIWARCRPARIGSLIAAVVLVAECGRRRASGGEVFPATSALWAPVWFFERGITAWAAIALRVRGGVRYSGKRLGRSARSVGAIRRTLW